MSQIYNKLKEIQKQKSPEAIAPAVNTVVDDILPPFSRASRRPVRQKEQFKPNVLFLIIVGFSTLGIIAFLLVVRVAGTQKHLASEKMTVGAQLASIKTDLNGHTKDLGQLAGLIKGFDKSIDSMDERIEASSMRFARIERQAISSAAEVSALRKENSLLLARIEALERKLNIKSDAASASAPKKKKLLGL